MDKKDIINRKVEEALAILMSLSSNFNFDFILNFTSPIEGTKSGMIYNEGMNMGILDHFIKNVTLLKSEINFIPNLLHDGHFIILCIDDLNKPANFKGEWIIKNHMYIAQEIRATSRGEFCYILKDLKLSNPYDVFSCERFVRIVALCDHN